MANRVQLPVMFPPLAPYNAALNPPFGTVSEIWDVDVVGQLGTFKDTSAATRATYPNALAQGFVSYQDPRVPNHWKSVKVYINITSTALHNLANA